jgi:hypothetical protein
MKTAYVDYNALSTLALTPTKADKRYQDWRSMQDLWKAFRAGRVRFVTSKQDMEADILLRLNGQGCCITDVLRAKEAVEEFENWRLSDKERTKEWKRVLFFGEQIEALPQRFEDSSGPGAQKDRVVAFLADEILSRPDSTGYSTSDDVWEAFHILQDCSRNLHLWYTSTLWEDLKRTDYQRNWEMLCSILPEYEMEPIFDGDAGAMNRSLFGLLNRFVGLCKKSYRNLPVDSNHSEFIIKTVMQKYNYREEGRNAVHIYRCAGQGIPFFLTTDRNLIERFAEKKGILAGYPGLPLASLRVVNPLEIQSQIGLDKFGLCD